MSNLSQFLGGTLTGSKVYYTQTSETKTLVAHEGVDKIVYVRNVEGYFGSQDITGIRKITADFFINTSVDVSIPDDAGIDYVKASFASPSINPTGLTFDSLRGNLISCDAGSDMIYVHTPLKFAIILKESV